MFTVEQIDQAHTKVRSGADFPAYIREIKRLGVEGFETFVRDSHSVYFAADGYRTASEPQYAILEIAERTDQARFKQRLQIHQDGQTDYYTFCKDCAEAGIEKWIVSLDAMTCIYYDKQGNEILVEKIPG